MYFICSISLAVDMLVCCCWLLCEMVQLFLNFKGIIDWTLILYQVYVIVVLFSIVSLQ